MALIKRRYIHEGRNISHLGGAAIASGLNDQMSRDQADHVHTFSDEEYQQKYQDLVQKANSESAGIIQSARRNAETEAQQLIENAKTEGAKLLEEERAKGFEMGRKEAMAQLEANIKESIAVIQQAKDQKNAIIKSSVPEMLKLCTKISAHVIKNEIAANPDLTMTIVRDAIEKISDNEQVVIKVSAQDIQKVRDNKDLIIDLVEAKNLSIVPDKHVSEGGCQIETKLGFIDARISTKLEMIESALIGVYEEEKVKKETMLKEKAERGEEVDFAKSEAEEIAELMQRLEPGEGETAEAATTAAGATSAEGDDLNLDDLNLDDKA